jgi:iron-sulfur cluster insertion protein
MILETSAIVKLKDILAEENNPAIKLRVFVQGGGCSGMSYGFTLDETQNEDASSNKLTLFGDPS